MHTIHCNSDEAGKAGTTRPLSLRLGNRQVLPISTDSGHHDIRHAGATNEHGSSQPNISHSDHGIPQNVNLQPPSGDRHDHISRIRSSLRLESALPSGEPFVPLLHPSSDAAGNFPVKRNNSSLKIKRNVSDVVFDHESGSLCKKQVSYEQLPVVPASTRAPRHDQKEASPVDTHEASALKIRRVRELRALVFLALSIAVAVLGYFSYINIQQIEYNTFQAQFQSSVDLMFGQLESNINAVVISATLVSKYYTYQFPSESDWPMVTLAGFEDIVSLRLNLTFGRTCCFHPIVSTHNRLQWEAYAANPSVYSQLNVAFSQLNWTASQGIYDASSDGSKQYAASYYAGSPYPTLLTPLWQALPSSRLSSQFLMNEHSANEPHAAVIDQVIASRQAVLSNEMQLIIDGTATQRPSSVVYAPILSAQNSSNVLGLVSMAFTWDEMFSLALPMFIVNVEVVLTSTSGLKYSFVADESTVAFKSFGDSHDRAYDAFKSSSIVSIDPVHSYTVDIYPTKELEQKFLTETPLLTLIEVICAIGGTALIFVIYLWASYDLDVHHRRIEREASLKNTADAEIASIIHTVCAPIFGVDSHGNVNMWNTRLFEISGFSAEEAIGKAILRNAIESKINTTNVELQLLMKFGGTRLLLVSASVRTDINDRAVGVFFVSSNDITALHDHRQHVVRNEAEKAFSHFIAHEIRNPLSVVDSASQLILGNIFKSKQILKVDEEPEVMCKQISECLKEHIRDVTYIRRCVECISYTLTTTLDLSLLESGNLKFLLSTVTLKTQILNPSIQAALSLKRPHVGLDVECDDEMRVIADHTRLRQVMTNLLTNAFKFTKEGSVLVRVKSISSIGGSMVRIEIRDTGMTIPPKHRANLFSKYGQTAIRQGTGLGLSLSHKLVLAMKGKLYLNEGYEKGTSFVIELPGEMEGSQGVDPMLSTDAHAMVPFHRMGVMIIDTCTHQRLSFQPLLHYFDSSLYKPNFIRLVRISDAKIHSQLSRMDMVLLTQGDGNIKEVAEFITHMRGALKMHATVIITTTVSEIEDPNKATLLEAGCDTVWMRYMKVEDMLISIHAARVARTTSLAVQLPCAVRCLILNESEESNRRSFMQRLRHSTPNSWVYDNSTADQVLTQLKSKSLETYHILILVMDATSGSEDRASGKRLITTLRGTCKYKGVVMCVGSSGGAEYMYRQCGADLCWGATNSSDEQDEIAELQSVVSKLL